MANKPSVKPAGASNTPTQRATKGATKMGGKMGKTGSNKC